MVHHLSMRKLISRLQTMVASNTDDTVGQKNPVLVLHNIIRIFGAIKSKVEGAGIAASVRLFLVVEVKKMVSLDCIGATKSGQKGNRRTMDSVTLHYCAKIKLWR